MLYLFVYIWLFSSSVATSEVPVKTIIDVLSSRSEFSVLVGLLQRHGLVPLINQSYNSTFLAPINSAFAAYDSESMTKDQLLYHFLNDTIVFDAPGREADLLVPSYLKKDGENVQVHLENGVINRSPARLVEQNLFASAQRGVVHAISEVVEVPEKLCKSLFYHRQLSTFSQIASIEGGCAHLERNVTLFAPSNDALEFFNDIELKYLTSNHGQSDRDRILRRHMAQGILKPQDLPCEVTMLDGTKFFINTDLSMESDFGNFSGAIERWVPSKTGVLNVYSQLLDEGTLIEFTPEKYVLALGGYTFAREVSLYGYEWLLDGTYTDPITIFVPKAPLDNDSKLSARGNYKFRADSVLYQFAKGSLVPTNEETDTLVDSAMTLKGSNLPQRMHVSTHSSGTMFVNWQPVVSEKYETGGATIYVVPGEIPAPPSFSMAIGPLFMSSHSLNFLDSLGLVNLPLSNSWTLLLPSREAWESQKLLMAYMGNNTDVLREFFYAMIYANPVYTDSGAVTTRDLSGQKVSIEMVEKSSSSSSYYVNVSGTTVTASSADILFDNGVAHIIEDIVLPSNLEITSIDLIEAGGRSEFVDLLEEFGFGYALNPHENYTIIVPDTKALAAANFTRDNPQLELLLKLHLIPGNHSQDMFDGKPLLTAAKEELAMHWLSSNVLAIRLVSGFGQSVYVTEWAETRGLTSLGSSVFFIDSFISPEWVHSPFLKPPFRMKTHTLLLLGIIVGLVLTSLFMLSMVYIFTGEKDFDEEMRAPLLREPSEDGEYQEQEPEVPTQPIRTTSVSEDRQFGSHLNLP
ncbi:hypothetical protein B9G98_04512 [Wickerhamiella sorbophila]|uniref:FAS1 domain-containing protein n=1 Tax=Wickerhamiella sorbophila TaxID=45607 RepID=A0A2T0FPI0_9ASCO|nr:hypothetical protein B9G98_04512 [Wickerhamiella sorbophila]PRT56892.1 hypothetical protein B9G98_04512 [Wickerhamiella sorbophila]